MGPLLKRPGGCALVAAGCKVVNKRLPRISVLCSYAETHNFFPF
jgi:hypothetical protein